MHITQYQITALLALDAFTSAYQLSFLPRFDDGLDMGEHYNYPRSLVPGGYLDNEELYAREVLYLDDEYSEEYLAALLEVRSDYYDALLIARGSLDEIMASSEKYAAHGKAIGSGPLVEAVVKPSVLGMPVPADIIGEVAGYCLGAACKAAQIGAGKAQQKLSKKGLDDLPLKKGMFYNLKEKDGKF